MDKLNLLTLVRNWFKGMNDQIPSEELLKFLCSEGYEVVFPDATLTDTESFNKWYEGIKSSFFDQNHIIRHIEIDQNGAAAQLAIWVNWQAKTRDTEHSKAQELNFDAFQQWQVIKESDRWVIKNYKVVSLLNNNE